MKNIIKYSFIIILVAQSSCAMHEKNQKALRQRVTKSLSADAAALLNSMAASSGSSYYAKDSKDRFSGRDKLQNLEGITVSVPRQKTIVDTFPRLNNLPNVILKKIFDEYIGNDGVPQKLIVKGLAPALVLATHAAAVNRATFSSNDRMMVTASSDGTARIWNVVNGEELHVLQGHVGGVNAATFSFDNSKIATAGDDGTARIWDAHTGEQLEKLELEDSVSCLAFSPNGSRLATSQAGEVRLWDLIFIGQELQYFDHDDFVSSVAFSPDGNKIVTVDDGHEVTVWCARTGAQLWQTEENVYYCPLVRSAIFSPDGSIIVTSGKNACTRTWNAHTGASLDNYQWWTRNEWTAFSPDGMLITISAREGTISLLSGVQDSANWAQFSTDGNMLVTANRNSVKSVWISGTDTPNTDYTATIWKSSLANCSYKQKMFLLLLQEYYTKYGSFDIEGISKVNHVEIEELEKIFASFDLDAQRTIQEFYPGTMWRNLRKNVRALCQWGAWLNWKKK